MNEEFLTVKQVAEKLGIQQVTVYKYIREGKLRGSYFKIGGIYRFSPNLLDGIIEGMIERDKVK